MAKDLTPQFSRKVLLLSLIFLLANLGIYGLKLITSQPETLRSVAPILVSARVADIEVKSPYDEDYQAGQEDQEIYSGTLIRTEEAEFAELVLESNTVRLDEQTEIRLEKNNFPQNGPYVPDRPRLVIELLSGSIWVDAFDPIEIRSPRSVARFDNSVGIVTYSSPINRLMVVTGAVDLELLSPEGGHLSDFVVPLYSQVTFVDDQVTATYAALKPSKLKKELKMTAISEEVLEDDWVRRNANDFKAKRTAFQDELITSDLTYKIRSTYHKVLSYFAFIPEARRSLMMERIKTTLAYLLGGIQEQSDLEKGAALLEEFRALIEPRENDPQVSSLIVSTLFEIEYTRCGTPAYLLKEYLIDEVLSREGTNVFEIYLADIRHSLYEEDIQASEIVAAKWRDKWKANLTEAELAEFDRQSQILDHTILSYIDVISQPVLDIFDETGDMKMAYVKDVEEARYEVISDRMQIASALIANYQYIKAKQYLKKSYLSLDIENLSQDLPSTKIFLETGKLLAQRIEYAEDVLHGAAEPIDETRFRDYFQTLKRDQALSEDLSKFFEVDEEDAVVEPKFEAPTAAQVAERFLEARINVSYADISLQPSSGYYYSVKNARLLDRGPNGEELSFNATYDYISNSLKDVVVGEKAYKGSYTLKDIVTLLRQGGQLESRVPTPKSGEGIELLITDQEKIEALEGQAIAQDVARQLAYSQLAAYGVLIPEARDIDILDELNLNRFHVRQALIQRPDAETPVKISFDYNAGSGQVTRVAEESGVILIQQTAAEALKQNVIEAVQRIERELEVIGEFVQYTKENGLYIDASDITYLPDGKLAFTDLELLSMEIPVSGVYDPEARLLVTASHSFLSLQNVTVRDYFERLADLYVVAYLQSKGFSVVTDQIDSRYPFDKVMIVDLGIEGYLFSFELDMKSGKALKITRQGANAVIAELTLEELKGLPTQLRLQEAISAGQ